MGGASDGGGSGGDRRRGADGRAWKGDVRATLHYLYFEARSSLRLAEQEDSS